MQDQSHQTTMFPQPIKPSQFPEQERLKCPRCDSPNTKFCYYNNYNLSQPRHFCKSCKRYWTKGGSLRNIPIGGGTRKATKRSSSSSSSGLKHRPSSSSTATNYASSTATLVSSVAENTDEMGQGSLMVDANAGSFSSMLASSNEQFGSIMEAGLGNNGGNNNQESYMSLQNGDWNNGGTSGWPDLAIYTPGSSFQ